MTPTAGSPLRFPLNLPVVEGEHEVEGFCPASAQTNLKRSQLQPFLADQAVSSHQPTPATHPRA
ncbi:MAG: hypothetical protein CBC35_05270 [Planctomycetes bacterium TMED75]|nr:MAG: hypothetical protein CBC35_05270 [Planctomycetes bacterium TMED75]